MDKRKIYLISEFREEIGEVETNLSLDEFVEKMVNSEEKYKVNDNIWLVSEFEHHIPNPEWFGNNKIIYDAIITDDEKLVKEVKEGRDIRVLFWRMWKLIRAKRRQKK